jgi:hypothetical protein
LRQGLRGTLALGLTILACSGWACVESGVRKQVTSSGASLLTCPKDQVTTVTESRKLDLITTYVEGYFVFGCGRVTHFGCRYDFSDISHGSRGQTEIGTVSFSCRPHRVYECQRSQCVKSMPEKLEPRLDNHPEDEPPAERRRIWKASVDECQCRETWATDLHGFVVGPRSDDITGDDREQYELSAPHP